MDKSGQKDLVPERWQRLREAVGARGFARVDELCEHLGVSPATVRRDLEALEQQGLIHRIHGGAMVTSENRAMEPLFDDRAAMESGEKRAIAREALAFVDKGDSIYLDGGSTILELARLVMDRTDLTVVTNSLRAAVELSGGGPRLILIGGELRQRSQTMVGTLTRPIIEKIHLDKAFMGTIGLSIGEGLTTTDPNEAFTKELVMERAEKVMLMADSTKLGRVSFARAGDMQQIDVVITDEGAEPALVQALRDRSIHVVLAKISQ